MIQLRVNGRTVPLCMKVRFSSKEGVFDLPLAASLPLQPPRIGWTSTYTSGGATLEL